MNSGGGRWWGEGPGVCALKSSLEDRVLRSFWGGTHPPLTAHPDKLRCCPAQHPRHLPRHELPGGRQLSDARLRLRQAALQLGLVTGNLSDGENEIRHVVQQVVQNRIKLHIC